METQSFPIIPAGSSIWLVLGPLFVFLIALMAVFGYFAYGSRNVRFEISPQSLRIRGDLYGRTIPRSELLLNDARPVNLEVESEYSLVSRTNGVGLPGYRSGWFRMQNGAKALAFITDPSRAVLIPVADKYILVASVPEPDRFLEALRTTR